MERRVLVYVIKNSLRVTCTSNVRAFRNPKSSTLTFSRCGYPNKECFMVLSSSKSKILKKNYLCGMKASRNFFTLKVLITIYGTLSLLPFGTKLHGVDWSFITQANACVGVYVVRFLRGLARFAMLNRSSRHISWHQEMTESLAPANARLFYARHNFYVAYDLCRS